MVRDIDPYAFVISKNLKRRHSTSEGKRLLITNVLRLMPDRSNNYIARLIGVDDKTVASVRLELEANSEIPNNTERTEASGRKARGRKPASNKPKDQNKPAAGQASAAAVIEEQQLDQVCQNADLGAALPETAQDDPVSTAPSAPLPPDDDVDREAEAAADAAEEQHTEELIRQRATFIPMLGALIDVAEYMNPSAMVDAITDDVTAITVDGLIRLSVWVREVCAELNARQKPKKRGKKTAPAAGGVS